ncbi:MAG: hypothetical protein WB615_07490 [Candidatus Tumulicola sp.]
MSVRTLAFLFALAAAATAPASAVAPSCAQETLGIRGTPVTVLYCIAGATRVDGDEVVVPVTASFAASGGSYGLSRDLHFIAGEGNPRVLERVELSRLGLTGVLHLTLVYAGGLVRVEGALLTPGGITIK